jgi:predicted transcriptional regulator
MSVGVAWTTLGFDAQAVILKLVKTPRAQRVEAARQELEDAKKAAKRLFAAHHPDTGGDPEKFKRIAEALRTIETETEEFARKMIAVQASDEERASKRPFIRLEDK